MSKDVVKNKQSLMKPRLFSGRSFASNKECHADELDRAITMANHGRHVIDSRAGNNSCLP